MTGMLTADEEGRKEVVREGHSTTTLRAINVELYERL